MQRLKLLLLLLLLFIMSCSQLNKASDLVSNRTAKEKYKRDFKISDELFKIWEEQVKLALNDSIKIDLPYLQAGQFWPRNFQIYSYNINLSVGEKLEIEVVSDSINHLVFIELYKKKKDSVAGFEKVQDAEYAEKSLSAEVDETGIYKVIIQPGLEANTPFSIKMKKSPVYTFPVAGGNNQNVQSLWGAARDGGKRSHEGVDIFAPRGTPVIAVTNGRITSSGERGLGGKQVWLRDSERGQSLYYAHLDSIAPLGNARVKIGDTIGFVGNTGNARTTPPHLHFGIYRGYRGAVNPYPHIFQQEEPKFELPDIPENPNFVTNAIANLRDQPNSRNSSVLLNLEPQDTLRVLGKTNEWYHIRTATNLAGFIHESLVSPL